MMSSMHGRRWQRAGWSASLAYDLGQSVRYVADGVASLSSVFHSRGAPRPTRRERTVVYSTAPAGAQVIQLHPRTVVHECDPRSREALEALHHSMRTTFESMRAHGAAPMAGVGGELTWHDLEALAEMSGLSTAIRDTAEIALDYDFNPVLAKLAANLERLGAAERRALAEQFLGRIEEDPFVLATMTSQGGRPPVLRSDEAERLVAVVTQHGRAALHQLSMTDADIRTLGKIGHDVSGPLVHWANVYLDPRTMSDQLRRYWRLQRIGFKGLQIMSRPRRMVLVEASPGA